jgi:prophage regulatory protein
MIAESEMSNQERAQTYEDELWSIRTVALKTGLSRASIYRYVARNLFPSPRRIGPGRVAWLGSEVRTWMQSRPRTDQHAAMYKLPADRLVRRRD